MGLKRSYGEACRLASALDLIGERWALLVVRELMLGPRRFTDLRAGLPTVSSNILSERLRELEHGGVIRRRKLPPPYASRVYELTEWGKELEPVVTALGAWGARSPRPPEHLRISAGSVVLALRSLFDPEAAGELEASYELRLDDQRFHVDVAAGEITLSRGPAESPAAVIEAEAATMANLLGGQVTLDQALDSGDLEVEGRKRVVARFLRLFPMLAPCEAAADQCAAPEESGVAVTV